MGTIVQFKVPAKVVSLREREERMSRLSLQGLNDTSALRSALYPLMETCTPTSNGVWHPKSPAAASMVTADWLFYRGRDIEDPVMMPVVFL